MKLIGASKVFLCDKNCSVIEDGGVVFEDASQDKTQNPKIIEVGNFKDLKLKHKNADSSFYEDHVLLPSLINAHIHFEYSANSTGFIYGDFGLWLDSLMKGRDGVFADMQEAIDKAIKTQLKSGVGSVGAVSSFGYDLDALSNSALRVVYFNEIIGSNPSMLDVLFTNFKSRLADSRSKQGVRFIPAIALHSPYSVHNLLAIHVLELSDGLRLSTHFLESMHEKHWLEGAKNSGNLSDSKDRQIPSNAENLYFYKFFKDFFKNPNPKPFFTPDSFLESFEKYAPNIASLALVHGVFMDNKHLEKISAKNYSLITCTRSNRLLSNHYLDIERLISYDVNLAFGTDGNSSNMDVNLLDEIRFFIFAYPHIDIERLANIALLGATRNGAKALNLNNGELASGKDADLALFYIKGIKSSTQAILQFILHARNVRKLFISGKNII